MKFRKCLCKSGIRGKTCYDYHVKEKKRKCKYCKGTEFWFDRSFEYDEDGNEMGMCYRCEKCGRRDE